MNASKINIRRFTAGDETSVKSLIKEIMAHEFNDDQGAYPTEDIEEVERSYGGLGEAFFVAEDNSQIVGTVAIKKEDDRVALLRRLFVAADYRKRKIGLELVDHALEFCHEVGYEEIIFRTTSRMQAAIKLCQKCGFIPRAKLKLGPIELLKFALSIRDGRKTAKSRS
ncbi:MAG: GNAT family N-acetyltransferase [Candidatus Omnitrophota bacterium]|nr:GNAT family N-acetyltransferase [Candidatus Omnitrophota bacterium]